MGGQRQADEGTFGVGRGWTAVISISVEEEVAEEREERLLRLGWRRKASFRGANRLRRRRLRSIIMAE